MQRVVEATWPVSIRLLLLLLADVDRPPHRKVDADVLIRDVVYLSANLVSARLAALRLVRARIGLHIDALDRVLKVNVGKIDASNAVVMLARWN